MSSVERFSCPDGITPNSGLTGPNNIYIYIYIYISKVKLEIIVMGDLKAPFFIQQGVGEAPILFPRWLHFTLDPYLIMLNIKQGDIKYNFLSFWYDSTLD